MNIPNPDIKFDIQGNANWDKLSHLWGQLGCKSLDFHNEDFKWIIRERFEDQEFFAFERNKMTTQRITVLDTYGLLGLSLINPKDTSVIITEGVSDFFTAKLNNPDKNVLGITTLGGNHKAREILLNLFDHFTICADNDVDSSTKVTGLANAMKWKTLFKSYNKECIIHLPECGKDITDEFFIKLNLAR